MLNDRNPIGDSIANFPTNKTGNNNANRRNLFPAYDNSQLGSNQTVVGCDVGYE
jgi:hypothetical protein